MPSFEGATLRFRPILMTTAAAILGAVPLAISFGSGGKSATIGSGNCRGPYCQSVDNSLHHAGSLSFYGGLHPLVSAPSTALA